MAFAVRGRRADWRRKRRLYAGFIADVERRLGRGDIDEDAAQEERAEAARALLKASRDPALEAVAIRPAWLLATVIAVAGLTFALYLALGHPSLNDQPYAQRLRLWSHMAASDPASLPFPVVAAVLRQDMNKPGNGPEYWDALGRAEMLAGDTYAGLKAYQRELAVAGPAAFAHWSELGEAMTLRQGGTTPEAQKVFAMALQRDPHDTRAHYYLGRQAVVDGQYDAARAHFQAALADVPAGDVRARTTRNRTGGGGPRAGRPARKRRRASPAWWRGFRHP